MEYLDLQQIISGPIYEYMAAFLGHRKFVLYERGLMYEERGRDSRFFRWELGKLGEAPSAISVRELNEETWTAVRVFEYILSRTEFASEVQKLDRTLRYFVTTVWADALLKDYDAEDKLKLVDRLVSLYVTARTKSRWTLADGSGMNTLELDEPKSSVESRQESK